MMSVFQNLRKYYDLQCSNSCEKNKNTEECEEHKGFDNYKGDPHQATEWINSKGIGYEQRNIT